MRSSLFLIPVLLLSLFTVQVNAQAITVDGSATTVADVETLITDILIGSSSECAEISNVSKSTGLDQGAGVNGIGSFEANGADFPYEAGIVLVSGNVNNVPGPEVDGTPSGGGWAGDPDLEANTTAINTNDASFIQFDFTPFVDELNFNFIMASEEYNQGFECSFSDAFAFILTDLTTGVVQNLAVLPGTNTPIEVTNIHPEVPGNCPAINEEYFDRYNFLPFNPEANSAINFRGQTVSLTAVGTVVVGNPYTIKLVVADQGDSIRDIAVFLEAGSFNLGVDIGGDRIGSEFNAACEGETLTLDATFDGAISYAWEVDNGGGFVPLLDGAGMQVTTPIIDVNVAGEYRVLVDAGTGCLGEDTAIIEFAEAIYNDPLDLTVCDDPSGDGVEIFNLNDQTSDILGTQDPMVVSVTYYENQSDAEMNINQISNPDSYTNTSSSQEIWVRVETDLSPDCFEVGSFIISVNSQTIANDPGIFIVCDDASDGSDTNGETVFDLSSLNSLILDTQDPTMFSVSYHETAVDATNNAMPLPFAYTSTDDMIWVRVENNGDVNCFAIREITLDVAELPVLLNNPVLLSQCDTDQDGFAFFNLTEAQTLLSADSNNETFVYFDSGGSPIVDPTAYFNQTANNESISVSISTINGCTRQAQIDLEVDTSEIPDTFQLEYFECDTDSDGQSVFDFSDATAQVLALFPAGQMLTVSYYETQQEAETETNPITATIDAYTNNLTYTGANGQQGIWVRVDGDTANDCRGLGIHVLLNVEANPTFLPNISSLEECSPIANAAQFDLTQNDAEITGGDPNILVTYYENVGNYTAMNAIANPTAFSNSSNPQTIYYSLEDATTGCTTFDFVNLAMNFEIIVNQNPVLTTPTELQVCDDDGVIDGLTTVDLSSKDIEITGGFDANLTITYHLDQAGADAGDASIPDKTMFTMTTNPQIVVGRVTDNTTACYSTVNLSVRSFPVPVPVTPADYEECDDDNDGVFDFFVLSSRDAEITGGDPTLTVAYYLTQADADNAPVGQELDNMMYINNEPFEQIVYARVFNDAGCYSTTPLTLRVLNTPMPNQDATPYALCDDDTDGLQIFDLSTQEANILGGLDAATHTVEWFSSLASAEAGTPAIATPTAYTSNTATVYALVTDTAQMTTTMTFCSNIAPLELIVNPLPTPIQPAEYELCDDIESGSDTDEFANFDLRSRDDEITGGNDDWSVSYHLTQADADAGTPALADMYQNVVMANQTIFVRVEDIVTSCYETITLTLVVNPLPSPTTIAPVEECDTMANDGDPDNDGDAIFDLTGQVTTDIINGEAFVGLSFHETIAAAELGTPAIANPATYQTPSRTIYVRATDTDPATSTECYRIVELELIVQPAPVVPTTIPDLTECDDDGDGQALFDLTQNDAVIYGTQTPAAITLTYHETLASAEAMVGSAADMPIADPVNYLASAPATQLWVRLEDTATGCTVVGTFNLNIAMIPTITPPGLFEACDSAGALVGTDDDGITTFDLTSLDAGITGGDPTLTVTYYESQADLDAGIANAIATPEAYINDGTSPQTLFILVSSSDAGMCGAETTVDLQVNPLPVIGEPLPEAIACDEDNDGFGAFDLQQYNDDLLATLTDITLRFYETLDNATADTGAGQIDITVPYNNITGMTSLYG
ncbi:hypothetical protein MED134_04764 [Dokdonia sp. MED134]|uniref:choice-of-anchor L domain-containing protein n=1 Tax=Dokdonia sp. MED134 TaxID=313590 RepID=UPI0004F71F8B|nr:choice-of-anchor L domain-containing protein [Dokdonia sp. MED134]EAQ40036.2 hypothetical protein MED134_04764 [Dokdonia sp. MED134]